MSEQRADDGAGCHGMMLEGRPAVVCTGPADVVLQVIGRCYRVEDHPMFGPMVLNGRGDPRVHQPPEGHEFWAAYYDWAAGGRRLDIERRCLWEPRTFAVPVLRRLPGRRRAYLVTRISEARLCGVEPTAVIGR